MSTQVRGSSRAWLLTFVGVIVVLGGLVVAARGGVFNTSLADLKAEQTDPRTKYATVDGVTIHYRDEGSGPVLVLLHAGNGNLVMWDPWVERMKGRFRLLRIDIPPYGLSGPDPTNVYGATRAAALIDGLVKQLGIQRFSLVGMSSGSSVAMRYAANYPANVDGLILSSIPVWVPPDVYAAKNLKVMHTIHRWIGGTLTKAYKTRAYWEYHLKYILGTPDQAPDWLIDSYWRMNNRKDSEREVDQYVTTNAKDPIDLPTEAAKVTVPVLIQWAQASPVLPPDQGKELAALFKNTTVKLIHYPRSGHYVYIGAADETAQDATAFLEQFGKTADAARSQ